MRILGLPVAGHDVALLRANHELGGPSLRVILQAAPQSQRLAFWLLYLTSIRVHAAGYSRLMSMLLKSIFFSERWIKALSLPVNTAWPEVGLGLEACLGRWLGLAWPCLLLRQHSGIEPVTHVQVQ